MVFEAGCIVHIKNYQFEDGNGQKDKFLLVVAVDSEHLTFIRTLTTSKQKLPDNKVRHGCCNSVDHVFSFYIFEQGREICKNKYCFPKHTFVYYQNNVLELSMTDFLAKRYDIEIKGVLSDSEYRRFIKCMKNSKDIKRGIKARINDLVSV